jgi:hypothetical protein
LPIFKKFNPEKIFVLSISALSGIQRASPLVLTDRKALGRSAAFLRRM